MKLEGYLISMCLFILKPVEEEFVVLGCDETPLDLWDCNVIYKFIQFLNLGEEQMIFSQCAADMCFKHIE